MKRTRRWLAVPMLVLMLGAACGGDDGGGGKAASGGGEKVKPEVVLGLINARVGPVASAGVAIGDAFQDWFKYINGDGGINGRKVKLIELETEYQVPKGIEAYNRLKTDGIAAALVAGTALSDALAAPSAVDKIPIMFPGQGNANTVDGTQFPYAFPGAPTYPHQASAAMQFIVDEWKASGKTSGPRVVCLGWEPPPGREYCNGVKAAAEALKATFVKEIVVPARAADVKPQILEAKAAKPDYVFHSTLFGLAVNIIKTACSEQLGAKVVSWHWAMSENEVKGAGPECTEGMTGSVMSKLPVSEPEAFKKLKAAAEKGGWRLTASATNNQLYGNGLVAANLLTEAIRHADKAVGDAKIDGPAMKAGLEEIKDFDGDGIVCKTTITPKNHGGNRALNVYRVEGGTFKLLKDCVEGPVLEGVEPKVTG
jgi:branched-chain amino acid transport system substrate-binding protein